MEESAGMASGLSAARRLSCLMSLTQIPTVAGREQRVVGWIRRWVAERPGLEIIEDMAGNLVVRPRVLWGKKGGAGSGLSEVGVGGPVYVTAHLDHPAFVVERVLSSTAVELAFRGGVMEDYFAGARVRVYPTGEDPYACDWVGADGKGSGGFVEGTLVQRTSPDGAMFPLYLAELDGPCGVVSSASSSVGGVDGGALRPGDVGVWALPDAFVDGDGVLHTHACDDLAALAAALCAMEELAVLHERGEIGVGGDGGGEDVRLLLTRAEEIGFVGAIAACRLGTMERGSRVVALENSRAFADSPVGGGPIVRVGDRLSIFSPRLTAAIATRAEKVMGRAATPRASEKDAQMPGRPWQRKLMAGGACEASVFSAYGYDSTCLCLPLGNYHNMADLAAMQAGTYERESLGPPRIAPEFISVDDFHGLVDLLVGIGRSLPAEDPHVARFEKLYEDRGFVL